MMKRTSWRVLVLTACICFIGSLLILPNDPPFASKVSYAKSADSTPQPNSDGWTLITSSNVTQLKLAAKIPLEPSFSMVAQIIWRGEEITAITGYSTIWIGKPDIASVTPYLINYAGGRIGKITISPDGRWLAAPVYDPNRFKTQVIIWDIATDTIITRIDAYGAEFSADSRFLALIGRDAIGLWDVNTQKMDKLLTDASISVDPNTIPPLSINPNSQWIASTNASGTLGLWDVNTSQSVRLLKDQVGPPREVWFRPDGSLLVARVDTRLQLWDVNTGNSVAVLDGHTDDVLDVSFSPDGLLLASVSADSKVLIWEGTTGALLTTLDIPDLATLVIRSVAFSPDGIQLAIGVTPLTNDKKQLGNPEIWLWIIQ